ncbi:MAG: type II 3-dehydroquinate dehydratase [Candidatus Methylomirabilaceae bacterium]
MFRVLVLHGPNLNMLGKRERSVYGDVSLKAINAAITRLAKQERVQVEIRHSNQEGELVTWIQDAKDRFDAIVINPAGYTHTSVALRDAIAGVALPTIEVHLTNIYRREEFRHRSYIAGVALGQISGFGPTGYLLGIKAAIEHLKATRAAAPG